MLMVINGYCELLLEDLDETDAIRADIERIKSTAGRAAALTRQLLAFGRRQVVQPKVLDLGKLLAGSREMVQRLVGENVTLNIESQDDPCTIYADPLQIEQVILNLAANARDAMLQGGQLGMEIRPVRIEEEESGERSIVPIGTYIVCSVQDSGSGMSGETLKHIFEPFFTTKESGKGTGLGLSTVYGIVKQNDGFVFAESEPGVGSCFTIYFPRIGEEELARGEVPSSALKRLHGSGRILLVEREAGLRRYTKTVLQKAGYSVHAAGNAADALGLGKTLEVDLLLSRSEADGECGVRLVEKIRQTQAALKVLMITDRAEQSYPQEYATIEKPFTSEALLRRIGKILA
jgi:two-component system cell cycle sensor histidine kinase/response regulator CckA